MAIVDEGNASLTRGVPLTLFTASAGQLPGIFGGKLDLNALSNSGDLVRVLLQVKYTSLGSFVDAEEQTNVTQSDSIFRFTPVEENYGYQIVVELLSGSPSASATLPYIITRSTVPT